MKSLLRSKSTIAVIVIVVILVFVYFYYNGSWSPTSAGLLSGQPTDQSIGATELSLLAQVQSLKIDTSLFQDPAYQSLQDYSRTIPTEPVGRPNPFEPYPGEALVPAAGGSSPAAH